MEKPLLESELLTARARSVIRGSGCQTVEEVRAVGYNAFAREPNCGARTLKSIEVAIDGWEDPNDKAELSVPDKVLVQMASAMLDPQLHVPGAPSETGNQVRIKVLRRALDAASAAGWTLTKGETNGKAV